MDLKGDPEGLRARINYEFVKGRARLVNKHVTDLEEVALNSRKGEGVHPVAEVIPDAIVVVLVEIAHGDPLAEEGRIKEPDQPPLLPATAAASLPGDGPRPGYLAGGRIEPEAPQSQQPHHRQSAMGHETLGGASNRTKDSEP